MKHHPSALEKFPSILHAEREEYTDPGYRWDNLCRQPAGTLVIQRTVRGGAVLECPRGVRGVGEGQVMVFAYGEPTVYRIGPEALRPYALEYLVLAPQGGMDALVAQTRDDFGDVLRMDPRGPAARIMAEIVDQFGAGRRRDQLELAELAYRLILALYREQISGTLGSDPAAYLRHLLQNQFRSPRNIKEWTHDLPMTREHLTRVFHARYGETPGAFLRRLRLEHARLLARTSTMTLAEIAAACGFSGARTLRRAYRERFGRELTST
jgi:AraC-like DNA-binding protein